MQVEENFLLQNLNTFGIAAQAKYFSAFRSASELEILLEELPETDPKLILGGGSNILFTKNFNGAVLKNEIQDITILDENQDYVYVQAGAGVSWHSFVMYCVENNWGGLENLSLIPGNVGASPMQNIGAYGVEIKDVFESLEAFHLKEKTIVNFNNADCEFGYRESIFKKSLKNQFAILNVRFKLCKRPVFNIQYGAIESELEKMKVNQLSVKAVSDAVIKIRQSKLPDPALLGNAGSFFKNPVINQNAFVELNRQISKNKKIDESTDLPFYKISNEQYKIPAGWLIEQCGFKGKRLGNVGCYEKQALVIVNYGGATGADVYNFSKTIIDKVQAEFGIVLEREVNVF